MSAPVPIIHAEVAQKANLAAQQRPYSLLRDLAVENPHAPDAPDTEGARQLDDLTLRLRAEPSFAKERVWRIDQLAPGSRVSITDCDVEIDGQFAGGLAEAARGVITLQVEQKDGTVLATLERAVALLARNEWGGAEYMPELLAAFSMPNDPAVDKILRAAVETLRRAGKVDHMDGYASGSRQRVWEMASAIYTAIAQLGLAYSLPAASFERDGQKIRLPSQIVSGQLATCLDTAMLFASVFEQAGLYPVVAMPEGHALAGVWLQPEKRSTVIIDSAESLRKRADLGELVLVETTCAVASSPPPFSAAADAGRAQLDPERDATFIAAVDIRAARFHIKPMNPEPEAAASAAAAHRGGLPGGAPALEEPPGLPDFDHPDAVVEKPKTSADRLGRWRERLLDLTARNPLLNYQGKTYLSIMCPDPAQLENKLAAGKKIAIQAWKPPATAQRARADDESRQARLREALDEGRVFVDLSGEALEKRAVNLYRRANAALREGGADTLYLSLGLLRWKRNPKEDRSRAAPLILLPVTLARMPGLGSFKMVAHEDDPRFNATLVEMLRKDFRIDLGALTETLPEDHSGIDVNAVWDIVRRAVRDHDGFELVEDTRLGHLSFAKYLMWRDLVDQGDALHQNAIVRHLIDSPNDAYAAKVGFVSGKDVDRQCEPKDLLTPLPADASQMAAVASADRGKNFVIIGPPGTGKSQTIANMIAHMLGKGKNALFVSAKTAALEAVLRRLKEMQLGNFCLELHSNKSRKADVLKQLRRSWDATPDSSSTAWEDQARQLMQRRDRLNTYTERLHQKHHNGWTAYQAMGVAIRDQADDGVALAWPSANQHDAAAFAALRETAKKLELHAPILQNIAAHPLRGVDADGYSRAWAGQLTDAAKNLSRAAQDAETACAALGDALSVPLAGSPLGHLQALDAWAGLLSDADAAQGAYALAADGPAALAALEEALRWLRAYHDARDSLSCAYAPFAWRDLDGDALGRDWQAAQAAWWPKRLFARRAVIQAMRAGGAQAMPQPENDAQALGRQRQAGQALSRLAAQLDGVINWSWQASQPDELERLWRLGRQALAAVSPLADALPAARLRDKTRAALAEGSSALEGIRGAAAAFCGAQETLRAALATLGAAGGATLSAELAAPELALAPLQARADAIAAASHREINAWCRWRQHRGQAVAVGLEPLVEALEQGQTDPGRIEQTFTAAYCAWWSGEQLEADETLRSFSKLEHENDIVEFRELSERFQDMTRQHIAAELHRAAQRSHAEDPKPWRVLQREWQKKKRHKAVRQLLKEAHSAVTALAPCFMMSPLSVAQYLSGDHEPFDIVIFDEASQIAVWDAIGALSRGRQVVVVGDPKQMPPTNFFERGGDADGDDDAEEDLESILDEMLASGIPEHQLNFHYRSRREGLIAFSNHQYYDGKLITFPEPGIDGCGVSCVRPEGFYARGGARHNAGEAKAIVAEVVKRLLAANGDVRKGSIGIVTFNTEQQRLIEDLLDGERRSHPDIEWAFRDDNPEALFVKNLETVQGDERDSIFFSITYGPDQTGHTAMNFGPLNRDGGERRLNVAVTRARSEMVIFSTLRPEHIDLSRSGSRAVADLKHFLQYAESGKLVSSSASHGSIGDFESAFEQAVAEALGRAGWKIHPQVGSSAYRIDLGIVHPDAHGRYLAGVECDGAMYHSSASAQERDKIRQAVLEDRGWTLLRVWSTDWWVDSAGEIRELDARLRELLAKDRAATKDRDAERQRTAAAPAPAAQASERPPPPGDSPGKRQDGPDAPTRGVPADATEGSDSDSDGNGDSGSDSGSDYVMTDWDALDMQADPEAFYADEYRPRLGQLIDHVIDAEGPIHADVLAIRIARHHEFSRTGTRIKRIVTQLAQTRRSHTQETVGLFLWPENNGAKRAPARCQGRDATLRKIEHICAEELRAIDQAMQLGGDPGQIARALGVSLSADIRSRIEGALRGDGPG